MVAVFGFVWFVVEISSLGDYEWACGCSAMGWFGSRWVGFGDRNGDLGFGGSCF